LPWHCAFHSTFRLLPDSNRSRDILDVFLESDGRTRDEVLAALPYARARAKNPGTQPDPKRYRDGRQLFRTVGLIYEEENTQRVRITALGRAVARWRPVINERNAPVLGRHAAQALAACQLRNPTGEGRDYAPNVQVFPFAFIWRAMLALGGSISSDELNRAVFRADNPDQLTDAIDRIRRYRRDEQLEALGDEVVSGSAKNDRIIVWMSWASFGWTLIHDKRTSGSGSYTIAPNAWRLVSVASGIRHRHNEFASERDYIKFISDCAGLPEDVR
jgi:hypothetical protein